MRVRQLERRKRRRRLKRQLSALPRSLPVTLKKLYNYPKRVRGRPLRHLYKEESGRNVLSIL